MFCKCVNFLRLNRDQLRKMQLQGLRWESNSRPHESSATLCQLSHEGRCWERVMSSCICSQLSPCEHPLLRTGAKSPAETTKKCMEITPAITDSRYYGIADTSCGPKQTFLLFYFRYNGHSRDNGHLTLLYLYCCTVRQKKDISHSVVCPKSWNFWFVFWLVLFNYVSQ